MQARLITVQMRMCSTSDAYYQCKWGCAVQARLITSANEDVQYKRGLLPVQMRMCSLREAHHQYRWGNGIQDLLPDLYCASIFIITDDLSRMWCTPSAVFKCASLAHPHSYWWCISLVLHIIELIVCINDKPHLYCTSSSVLMMCIACTTILICLVAWEVFQEILWQISESHWEIPEVRQGNGEWFIPRIIFIWH